MYRDSHAFPEFELSIYECRWGRTFGDPTCVAFDRGPFEVVRPLRNRDEPPYPSAWQRARRARVITSQNILALVRGYLPTRCSLKLEPGAPMLSLRGFEAAKDSEPSV
jgi:hypothetical protein